MKKLLLIMLLAASIPQSPSKSMGMKQCQDEASDLQQPENKRPRTEAPQAAISAEEENWDKIQLNGYLDELDTQSKYFCESTPLDPNIYRKAITLSTKMLDLAQKYKSQAPEIYKICTLQACWMCSSVLIKGAIHLIQEEQSNQIDKISSYGLRKYFETEKVLTLVEDYCHTILNVTETTGIESDDVLQYGTALDYLSTIYRIGRFGIEKSLPKSYAILTHALKQFTSLKLLQKIQTLGAIRLRENLLSNYFDLCAHIARFYKNENIASFGGIYDIKLLTVALNEIINELNDESSNKVYTQEFTETISRKAKDLFESLNLRSQKPLEELPV